MVLQRTIENLRERPHDERRAVALGIAIAVMVVIFFGWAAFFFRDVNVADVQQVSGAYNDAVANVQQAYSETGWVSEAQPETAPGLQIQEESQNSADSMELIEEEPVIDTEAQ